MIASAVMRGPLILIALASLLMGCGKPDRAPSGPPSAPSPHHEPLAGSISEAVERIQAGEDAEDCDRQLTAKRLEVARALDERTEALLAFRQELKGSGAYRRVPLGPTYARERVSLHQPIEGWQAYERGWEEIHESYQRIRSKPLSKEWLVLEDYVRGILVDDLDRAVEGMSFYYSLDKDAGPKLERLGEALERCIGERSCESPRLDDELISFVGDNPVFGYFFRKAEKQGALADKRAFLAKWLRWVNGGKRRYAHRLEPTVRRPAVDQLQITLDIGSFVGAEDAFTRAIEDVWRGFGQAVQVHWGSRADSPDIFRILLAGPMSKRGYIDRQERVMGLYPGTRIKTIAHEFGHILGFPDHYYTTWDSRTCRYKDEYREDDIMSDVDLGTVTEEEWATLGRVYRFGE